MLFIYEQFTRFMRFVVGLWSSKPTPSGVVFEPSKAITLQVYHILGVALDMVRGQMLYRIACPVVDLMELIN